MQLISLGRRILRTETAGIAALRFWDISLESQTDGRLMIEVARVMLI